MTKDGGEDLLRTCLAKLDSSIELSKLLCYKTGNRKQAEAYNGENIDTVLYLKDKASIEAGVLAVVKCFYHIEVYVAWHTSIGIGSGKYRVHKSDLIKFENDKKCSYWEVLTGTKDVDKVYFFRNESGIEKFFKDALGIMKQNET